MSEDGFSDSSDEPNMEIQIETLMGNSFDLRVSATDTVQEIKRRIHRVEGIPITHQNLLYQSRELQDSRRLVDVGIKDGAKLKLVLSMRGGPISTRRISTACEHQLMLKELKEFLDSTREEIDDRLAPGSKISVLVFKEGDIINLLRVIENEDGSYVPYSEKTISPPTKNATRVESRTALFEKLVEDNKMMSNVTTLRKKMEDVATARKKRTKNNGANDDDEDNLLDEASAFQIPDLSFKLFKQYNNDDVKIIERNDDKEEGNQSESEEIALKDKHRSKQIRSPRTRIPNSSKSSLFAETKGVNSHTKHTYVRMQQHKKNQHKLLTNVTASTTSASTSSVTSNDDDDDNEKIDKELLGSPILAPLCVQSAENTITEIDKIEEVAVASSSSRLHVARLLISENSERPKSTSDGLEVEDNGTDLWAQTTSRHNLKSATYKLGVLKRRQSLNYGIDADSAPKELTDFNGSSGFEVCSSNFYHVPPPFVASPSAIPPQYAPKNHEEICDFYCSSSGGRNRPRSPLYGRKSSSVGAGAAEKRDKFAKLPDIKSDYAAIQRLKNDGGGGGGGGGDLLFEHGDAYDELCSYYNLGNAGDLLGDAKILDRLEDKNEQQEEKIELPPVIKKRARCNFCNRKLNITNIYNCRCGKIFCSQHRYSEVHHCNYDYKTDGRRFLEQQNPLVTADKINRF